MPPFTSIARRILTRAVLGALLLAPAVAVADPAMPGGDALHRALLGVWCNSDDGGRTCWAWDEFFADGGFEACGRTEDDGRAFAGAGRVTVEGRRMCYTLTRASESFWLRPGDRYCSEIVAIDAASHRYRDLDSGREHLLLRRPAADKRCPPMAPAGR